MDDEEFSGLLASLSSGIGSGSGGALSQPDSPSPSSSQHLSDRLLVLSSSSSGSASPGGGVGGGVVGGQGEQNRPRRHLPSPALAQAKSLLKLTRGSHAGHSFDVGDLAALHLQAMTSSPSAPVVSIAASTAATSSAAGRKLPVPGRHHFTGHYNHHQHHHHHHSSHLSLASAADALNEMDALIHHRSGPSPLMSNAGALSGSNSSINSNSSSSRKLPVPPIVSSGGGGSGGMSQPRRLLPRPLSCDVPCYSDISSDFVPGGSSFLSGTSVNKNNSSSSSHQQQRNRNNHLFLSRPLSFDCPPPDAELEEAATLLTPFHIDIGGSSSSGGSDPNLMRSSLGRGLMRQSSTTSCPSLMRPCRSPRSPNYHSSSNTTPSPLPPPPPLSFSQSMAPSSSPQHFLQFSQLQQQQQPLVTAESLSSSVGLQLNTNTLVPFLAPPPTCSLPSSSSGSPSSTSISSITAAAASTTIGLPRPQTHYWPPPLIEHPRSAQNAVGDSAGGQVLIPSVGSAFRAPLLQHQHRQASLPPASMSDYLAEALNLSSDTALTNAAVVGGGGLQQQLTSVLRRQRFQGGANGSISGSIQEYPASFQRLDWQQRPSRSRPPARHYATSAMARYKNNGRIKKGVREGGSDAHRWVVCERANEREEPEKGMNRTRVDEAGYRLIQFFPRRTTATFFSFGFPFFKVYLGVKGGKGIEGGNVRLLLCVQLLFLSVYLLLLFLLFFMAVANTLSVPLLEVVIILSWRRDEIASRR